jgi:hypothetical protein
LRSHPVPLLPLLKLKWLTSPSAIIPHIGSSRRQPLSPLMKTLTDLELAMLMGWAMPIWCPHPFWLHMITWQIMTGLQGSLLMV